MNQILIDDDEKEFLARLKNLKERLCIRCDRLKFCEGIRQRCLEIWEEGNRFHMKCENFAELAKNKSN